MITQSSAKRQRSARVEQKHQRARQEILQVAEAILQDRGIDAVTLASVAGELHMTKQALYHYFPSKVALLRSLVAALVGDEIETLIAAIESGDSSANALELLIRAFHDHYINRLNAFRTVYCQSQLYSNPEKGIDKATIRKEINPRTRHLFDVMEERISNSSMNAAERERMRQLAFTAWLSALGLMTMLGIADATDDPLIHTDQDLLNTLSRVFGAASK